MIIVNADDWGRSRPETDAAMSCFLKGRITSTTAMVFMEDSERAANLAKDVEIDVGLHLNLSQKFSGTSPKELLSKHHNSVVRFLTVTKYSQLIYNPVLREQFRHTFLAQLEEFIRLYRRMPSHIDGHHHKHLCSNMLLDNIIPPREIVRRNFSFLPEEKSFFNRAYRKMVDKYLSRNYRITDYFFALSHFLSPDCLTRITRLADDCVVELMTHPGQPEEFACLMSDSYKAFLGRIPSGTFASL
jgi:predicted glycoside hydrolase/deacetylase ChbG (UPF0249 family)